jgi:hypothetical protein
MGVSVLAACGLLAAAGVEASVLNHSAGFRWKGHVSTGLALSSFYPGDHSVVLRFMAQYPTAYQGPMFTTSADGNYLIGIGNYSEGTDRRKLQVTFGGRTEYYSGQNVATDLRAGKWNTVVVVKEDGRYRLWLNGQLLARDGCTGTCTSFAEGPHPVSGNVRLGRTGGDENAQFYGFLDDVEVFDRALGTFEIGLINLLPRLSGNENGVLRAWTFDDAMPNGEPNPPTVGTGSFSGTAFRALLSELREEAFDAGLLPPPTITVDLPFPPGVAWKVLQGFGETGSNSSHHGNAAFFWDFVRNLPDDADTCGSRLVAAAPGTIVLAHDQGGDLDPDDDLEEPVVDAYNQVRLQLGTPGEFLRYLHVQTGSVRAALDVDELPPGTPAAPVAPIPVAKGTKVAEAGTRGPGNCHLHFGYRGETVSIPLGLNYERWDAAQARWIAVQNGMPGDGQVIRKP